MCDLKFECFTHCKKSIKVDRVESEEVNFMGVSRLAKKISSNDWGVTFIFIAENEGESLEEIVPGKEISYGMINDPIGKKVVIGESEYGYNIFKEICWINIL